jgi:hypothetical protein
MENNGEKFVRRATRTWRLRRPRHIGSSCSSLELLAPHHARLLARSADDAACGRAGASGAAAAFLSMRICRRSVAGHVRLLARSGAAAEGGRTGASGATQRVLRTHCGVAESGFIGRRRRIGRALYPPTDACFEMVLKNDFKGSFTMILKDRLKSF